MNTYHISITYHKLSLQKSKTSTCLPFFVSYRPILIFKILSQILSKKFIDSLLSGTLIVYIRKGQRNTKALREKDRTQKNQIPSKTKPKSTCAKQRQISSRAYGSGTKIYINVQNRNIFQWTLKIATEIRITLERSHEVCLTLPF